jgi:hypothetical protein
VFFEDAPGTSEQVSPDVETRSYETESYKTIAIAGGVALSMSV